MMLLGAYRFIYWKGQHNFLFSYMPRPVLGPTQSPLQWVLRFFPGRKWLVCKVDHSPIPSAKVKNDRSYNSSPLHAFMAWTGTNLLFCVCVCARARAHVHVPKSSIPAPSMECSNICGITSNLCIFLKKHQVIITVIFIPKFHSSSHNNIFTKKKNICTLVSKRFSTLSDT